MRLFKKLLSATCALAMVIASATSVSALNLRYSSQAPSSYNITSGTVTITPIQCTYNGVYGWHCYAHCTSISGTSASDVTVLTSVYINGSHSGSSYLVEGGKVGSYRLGSAPSSYASCSLSGNYNTYSTTATIVSCTSF